MTEGSSGEVVIDTAKERLTAQIAKYGCDPLQKYSSGFSGLETFEVEPGRVITSSVANMETAIAKRRGIIAGQPTIPSQT